MRRVNKFPEVLKALLKEKNEKQIELSDALGLGYSTVRRWLHDEGAPKFYDLIALSEHFKVSIDYLVYGDKGE